MSIDDYEMFRRMSASWKKFSSRLQHRDTAIVDHNPRAAEISRTHEYAKILAYPKARRYLGKSVEGKRR